MIDVVSYLNTGLASTPTNKSNDVSDLGKDAFMELLITQMTNQNPLEPMENTEFIAQLAQFSALEQQQNIAQGIELLALTQTASTNSQMVNLIGKRVLVPGSEFTLDGEKGVELHFDLTGNEAPSEMTIKDEFGQVVKRINLDNFKVGENKVAFDGKDEDGNALAAGNYTYSIADADGDSIDGLKTYSNYLVDSVAFNGSSILLKSYDKTINLEDINEVIQN
ncbi:MAG: hypothetical protein GY765_04315 [bacterium]|nr:hypothetical protein [bacterium]